MLPSLLLLGALAGFGSAQFPPKPKGVTILKSKFHENVTISYKEPGICETTPGVKSYAGYVHLPPGFLNDVNGEPQNYPVNTFFWFFEARKDPANAPLAIWLNGGPGGSSMLGLLQENGPCIINPDSKTTSLNPWSWNNEVNMIYIDEPNQVGLSYDIPTNCTVNAYEEGGMMMNVTPAEIPEPLPATNLTSRYGTFASQNASQTTNSTAQAAHALWHFAQTWFFEFPHYKPEDDRVSLWAESYGGHYGPGFMRFFQQQNEKIANGTIEVDNAHYLHLDTLGIVNGYLDAIVQTEAYIDFPYNNTYGIQVFNESIHDELMFNFTKPGGCKEQMLACRSSLESRRLFQTSNHKSVTVTEDDPCDVESWCENPAETLYQSLDRSWFDIGHTGADPSPPPYYAGYVMDESVLEALGAPVNFSWVSPAVVESFSSSGDEMLGFLDATGYLLDNGVKVHMMYGDRDYACAWTGGERVSLEVPYSRADDFAAAGYAPLVSLSGVKGMTRQFGNYSFTRVFQAGHEVPAYQPEAAYDIFMRATFNRDVATGLLPVTDELATVGPRDTWHIKNEAPQQPDPLCYVLSPQTCEADVWKKVWQGAVTVKDWVVVGIDDEEGGEFKSDEL